MPAMARPGTGAVPVSITATSTPLPVKPAFQLLQERVKEAGERCPDALRGDLHLQVRRIRLIYLAILAAIFAALLICLVVAGAFLGALASIDVARTVAVCFILAMSAMIVSLGLFLREVYLGVSLGVSAKH